MNIKASRLRWQRAATEIYTKRCAESSSGYEARFLGNISGTVARVCVCIYVYILGSVYKIARDFFRVREIMRFQFSLIFFIL